MRLFTLSIEVNSDDKITELQRILLILRTKLNTFRGIHDTECKDKVYDEQRQECGYWSLTPRNK